MKHLKSVIFPGDLARFFNPKRLRPPWLAWPCTCEKARIDAERAVLGWRPAFLREWLVKILYSYVNYYGI